MSFAPDVSSKVLIDKSNGNDYATWSSYVRGVLLTKSVWGAVKRETTPTFTDSRGSDEYSRTLNFALGLMLLHMGADCHRVISECELAWIAWAKLYNPVFVLQSI